MDQYKEFPYISQTLDYLIERSKNYQQQISFDYLKEIQIGKITSTNRESLIHWLSEICEEKGFPSKVEQLSISYIDLFLSKKSLPDPCFLELITYTCLSISLKYEELRHISYQDIFYLCGQKYSEKVIETTQVYILTLLDWKLEIPTPNEILTYLLMETCESIQLELIKKSADGFIMVARSDYELSRQSPVSIAIASALCVFEKSKLNAFAVEWLQEVSTRCELDSDVLKEMAKKIWDKVNSFKH